MFSCGWRVGVSKTRVLLSFLAPTWCNFVARKLHQVSNMFENPSISRRQITLKITRSLHVRFWSCNFSGRSCWCNFQRAAHKDCKRQTWRWYSDYFICPMPALSVLYFVIERSVLMALVFYYKDILDVKNPVILRMFFVTERTSLTTCSACVAKSKNCHWMQDSSLGNTPISENHSLEFHEIWHENT